LGWELTDRNTLARQAGLVHKNLASQYYTIKSDILIGVGNDDIPWDELMAGDQLLL
jgi:hypothetical protein